MMTSCIVVAGGKGRRMRKDKKFIEMGGKRFIQHVVKAAEKFSKEIIVVVGSDREIEETLKFVDVCVIKDEIESKGPVMGILTGLKKCSHEYSAITSCDNPFIEPRVFQHMINEIPGYDAVVPKWNGGIEPLRAVYKVASMIEACKTAIENNRWSLGDTVSSLRKVKYIKTRVFRKYDKDLLTFCNINTREDLIALLSKYGSEAPWQT